MGILELNKQNPNATIYDYCYKDVSDSTDFSLSRIFSFRNRFGPSFSYELNSSDPNIKIAIELKLILSTMTCIEVAAIRQITPLISIVKLAYGNIGSKGNTTCMWNESKLSIILPNLPSKCQYFVLSFKLKKIVIL